MVKILSRDELQAASCGLMKIACMALMMWANHTVQTMSSRCTPTPRKTAGADRAPSFASQNWTAESHRRWGL